MTNLAGYRVQKYTCGMGLSVCSVKTVGNVVVYHCKPEARNDIFAFGKFYSRWGLIDFCALAWWLVLSLKSDTY
jgi:hypothetical protein